MPAWNYIVQYTEVSEMINGNLLLNLTEGELHNLKWLNMPEKWEKAGEGIILYPKANSDFFNDPQGIHMKSNAPYLYLEAQGDFVARALVKPCFGTVWDAAVLMLYLDAAHWAKLCFEWSDAGDGYKGIVNVVTKDTSDDANGQSQTAGEVWLQICRVGSTFAMHWSLDGAQWNMARLFAMPCGETVSIGLEGQCPAGPSVGHEYKCFTVEHRTVGNLRQGI